MAFWKRLSNKKSQPVTTSSNPPIKTRKSLSDTNVSSSLPLSPTGDLADIYQQYQLENSPQLTNKTLPTKTDTRNKDLNDLGDLTACETIRSWPRRSRLTKNLQETLQDLTALNYFQHFLESKQANTYLNLLNDIKNYQLLVTSITNWVSSSLCNSGNSPVVDGSRELRCSPTKGCDQKAPRLLNSTSSSSGFSDDISLDSPAHNPTSQTSQSENETMLHNLMGERRRILQKYFDPESSDFLPNITTVIKETESTEVQDILCSCFDDTKLEVYNILETEYFGEYLHSEYHYRHQLEIITSGKLIITDILYNDTCFFYFMEYMDQENKRHWIEFWLAADNYRSQWNTSNAASDALTIYNKYFSLQASQPLGLADSVRSAIEENICSASSGPGPDCFENAVHFILCAMEKRCLSSFLSSPVFSQYVNEVHGTLRSLCSSSLKFKRSGSTSTVNSEASYVSTSTFSAALSHVAVNNSAFSSNSANHLNPVVGVMGDSSMIKLVNCISNESLIIELRQLNDPDTLWQRKKLTLSLGKLNPFGRFYTETEPLPDRKTGSVFSKAIKKFVLIEDQEKEEAAWQAAEMIVRDVIAITLRSKSFDASSRVSAVNVT